MPGIRCAVLSQSESWNGSTGHAIAEDESVMTYRTYHQYLNHPRFIAIKKQVMNRDNNRCVDCNQPATEVHHERYCEWGKFDVVSNLVAVCHSCHCNRHRCEQCNEIKLKAFEIKRQRKTCRACYQGQQ